MIRELHRIRDGLMLMRERNVQIRQLYEQVSTTLMEFEDIKR